MKLTLKAARINAGMTQVDVAKKLGVSTRTVGAWENEKNKIRPVYVLALSALYNISTNDFIMP